MPVFLCRWPNGDCSIILARNRAEAIEQLDEVGNAEGCPLITMSSAQVHFHLTDDGELALDGLGEDTAAEIFTFCYPALVGARTVGTDLGAAVQHERTRLEEAQAEGPVTEVGRRVKARLDMPTELVDRLVSRAGKQHLRSFKSKGKPS